MTFDATFPYPAQIAASPDRFVERIPRDDTEPRRRFIVTSEVNAILDGTQSLDGIPALNGQRPLDAFPKARAAIDLDNYLTKRFMFASLVTLPSNIKVYLNFERLENIDEVWAFCIRMPRPGWRILGRFIGQDAFVGVAAYDRHQLGGDRYLSAATALIESWPELVGTEPIRRDSVREYISEPVRDPTQDD